MYQMTDKGEVESMVCSLSRFSEMILLILTEMSKVFKVTGIAVHPTVRVVQP
jgi:hypothetical protein